MDAIEKNLLHEVAELDALPVGAYISGQTENLRHVIQLLI